VPADRAREASAAMRRAIGLAMSRSKREIPHYYLAHTIDLGPALQWLARENAARPVERRLLPAVLLLRAATRALEAAPELNAHWLGEDAPPLPDVHLGVAIALRGGGLVAPAIEGAHRLSLDQLREALESLVQRSKRGALRASELTGATITVTSLGERGVEFVQPIIHPPQVAMVGLGAIVERPWVVGGEVRPRPVVTATLAADHRVSDGHHGARYLAALERNLLEPEAP
jgi:pyruvate dehydrogenase E2 component (dihydrolipoamide acetyltransferase)